MPLDPGRQQAVPRDRGRLLLEDALPLVSRIVGFLRRRHRLGREEAEDFESFVHERLLEDDCKRLRAFSCRSKLSTYLATVINRLFVDYRRLEWGPRWQPSAEAVRLGPLAIRLEELWQRDALPYEAAAAWLVENAGAEPAELEEIATRLPLRNRVRIESGAAVAALEVPDPAPDPEQKALAVERASELERLRAAMTRELAGLQAADRCILQMHFLEGMTIAEIATVLRLEQRPIYRRRDRLLSMLRESLVASGWNDFEARRVLAVWEPEG